MQPRCDVRKLSTGALVSCRELIAITCLPGTLGSAPKQLHVCHSWPWGVKGQKLGQVWWGNPPGPREHQEQICAQFQPISPGAVLMA